MVVVVVVVMMMMMLMSRQSRLRTYCSRGIRRLGWRVVGLFFF